MSQSQLTSDSLQGALKKFEEAISIYEKIGDEVKKARLLNGIGLVYKSLGEPQKALDSYTQSLLLMRAAGDREGESTPLTNIGTHYSEIGEMQKALDYHLEALAVCRALNDQGGEALTLHNIGLIYSELGEWQKALDYHTQSLLMLHAAGDRIGEALTHSNMGRIYLSLGERQKALDFHLQALAEARAVAAGTGVPHGQTFILNNIGIVYNSLGERQKALDYFTQALAVCQALNDHPCEAITISNIGNVYLDSGEHRKALEYFTQALPSLRAASDYVVEADTLYGISRAYDGLGELQKALESSSTALSLIENLRTKSSKSSEMRASYLASKQSYYFNHLDLLIRMHKQQPAQPYDVQAYQVSERMRARSLLDLLNESGTDIRQGVSPALLERERLLRQQFTAKGERQVRLLNSQAREEEQAAIAKEVSVLAEQYQQVQAQIRQQSPAYAALTQPQPLTLAEVQQHVLDNDTLLLQYSLGEKRSYLWTVTPTTMRVYELPPGAEITEAARRVYELMTARQPRPQESRAANEARVKQANAAYEGAARALSRMVLGPAAGELGGKRLAVVADGALQFVPFAALPEPQPEPASAAATTARTVARKPSEREKLEERAQPLLIRHEVVNLPSASSLAVLRQEVAGRVVPPGAVAVLADPVFSRDDSRLRASGDKQVKQPAETAQSDAGADTSVRALRGLLGVRGERLGRLAFSREEGRSINNAAPAGQALLATDFAANRRTAMSEGLGRYKYVHFATHGILNAEHPELSGIVLSLVDQKGDPQDGFLGLSEVYNLKLPVEMVTLSACQTGLGKEVKGEGLIGLTRGFMYAGTRRVLASLWQVEDQATAELMKRMYEKMLRSGERPAAALRAAQLEMMRSREQWRAPYYWAGFVMQGEWR